MSRSSRWTFLFLLLAFLSIRMAAFILYPMLPDRVVTRFDGSGHPAEWSSRSATQWFLIPGLATGGSVALLLVTGLVALGYETVKDRLLRPFKLATAGGTAKTFTQRLARVAMPILAASAIFATLAAFVAIVHMVSLERVSSEAWVRRPPWVMLSIIPLVPVVLLGGVMIFGERPSASPRAASGPAGRPGPLLWAATLSAVAGTAALWTLAIRLRDSLPATIPTGFTLDGTLDGSWCRWPVLGTPLVVAWLLVGWGVRWHSLGQATFINLPFKDRLLASPPARRAWATEPMAAAFAFIGTLFSGFFVTDLIVTERIANGAWASATPFRLGFLFPAPLFVWLLVPVFTVWWVNGLPPVDGDRARD